MTTRSWGDPGGRSAREDALGPVERLWTFQDVSDFLGVPIGTLYQWRVRGEGPPAFKLGKHVRFDPERVRAWLDDSAA